MNGVPLVDSNSSLWNLTISDRSMKFRYSIRDILWLVTLIAVLAAWWVDRQIQTKKCNLKLNEYAARCVEFIKAIRLNAMELSETIDFSIPDDSLSANEMGNEPRVDLE